ncbi:MAG TPA: right-handed parallel beta-helix repeat-containing protein [bacterium]|nr:right-handed parallel beta-helix repeat-containing protein [bacterium]
MKYIRHAFVFLALLVLNLHAENDGYMKWQAQKSAVMQDKGLARYYTFEDVKDSKSVIKDLKGSGADLVFMPYREGEKAIDDLQVVEGRVAGRKAVRLDRGWYQGPAFDIKKKQFTVSVWFRRQGPGSIPSASMAEEGRIISSAGWKRGWYIAAVYDEANTLRFCLGSESGSENLISDISVPGNVWHHLAAVWDGKEMLLYFNGMLVGKSEYSGRYIPAETGDFLRLGYAGDNTGSLILDIDEVVFYNSALTRSEVVALSTGTGSHAVGILKAADKYIEKGDYEGARREYGKLEDMKSVEYGREIALFNIAESYRLEKDYERAHKTYKEIFSLSGLTANYRIYGLFMQAEVYEEEGDYGKARKAYSDIVSLEGAQEDQIFRARLHTGDTWRKERKYAQARDIYLELLKGENSSSYPHENYRLELADRLDELEGMKDGQAEKSKEEKRAEWVNSPEFGIYVSLQGKDTNPGTKESPFATINRAQEEVRRIKRERGMPEGGIAVYLRGGKYFIKESVVFGKEDSGTESSPVVYRSYPGEEVRLIGGKELKNFKPLKDPDIMGRLPEEAKDKVWVSDLREAGITDYGNLVNRGHGYDFDQTGAMELFYNTRPMTLSRFPDEGWLFTNLLTSEGDGGSGETVYQKGRFMYSEDRPERWKEEKNIWAVGYFAAPWDKVHTQVIDIDAGNKTAYLAPDIRHYPGHGNYGMPVRDRKPYYFYNILGEISKPGEFYVDRETGKLYFYPPGEIKGNEIIVSILAAPVVEIREAENLVLFGLIIEGTWKTAITVNGGINNLVAGSVIRNTGQYAFNIKGGWRNGVFGCDIYDVGEGGIRIEGGNWRKLIPGNHYVENNHIHRFNRFDGGYRSAVRIEGIGHRVSHNLISDSSHNAIYLDFNNHVIEYNEIYDVVSEARDAGAIYIYGEPKYLVNRGNIFRYNFIHHITEHSSAVPYVNPGITGIYIDALNAGMTIVGNIIYRNTGAGIFTHGPDTRVENNIFADNLLSLHQGNRNYLLRNPARIKQLEDNVLNIVNYRQPPWANRYPQLRNLTEGGYQTGPENPAWPRNVAIERNINIGGQFLRITDDLYKGNSIKNNMDGYDPLFSDSESLDFSLSTGSPAYGITGQEPVPFAEIGLYRDSLRASWPVKKPDAGKYYSPEKMAMLPPPRGHFGPLPFTGNPPFYEVIRSASPITIDGKISDREWQGLDKSKAMNIEKSISGKDFSRDRSYAWMLYDDENIYIAVENIDGIEGGEIESKRLYNEIDIEGIYNRHAWWWQRDIETGPVYILSGYANGRMEVMNNFRMPRKIIDYIKSAVEYRASVVDRGKNHWTAEWKIPFAALNTGADIPDELRFNIGGPRKDGWFNWSPTGGSAWRLDKGGILRFIK